MAAETVLVVDDQRAIVELLAGVLGEEGYRVRAARDGLEALAEAERRPPDLVVADVAMPGLDGVALARRLAGRGVPVLLMSAAAAPAALPAGVGFVPKPFDLCGFLERVGRALDGAATPSLPAAQFLGRDGGLHADA